MDAMRMIAHAATIMANKSNQALSGAVDDLALRLDAFREYIDHIMDTTPIRSPSEIAGRAGVSPSTVNRPYKGNNKDAGDVVSAPKGSTLLAIHKATGVGFTPKLQRLYGLAGPATPIESAEADAPLENARVDTARASALRPGVNDVPVLGVVRGGSDGAFELNMDDPLDYVRRPLSVTGRGEIYAVHIDGISMVPAFRPGETALVWAKRPALIGRDVVIQVRPDVEGDNPKAYLKTLIKRTSTELVVQQYTPHKIFTFKLKDVISVHMVLTRDEMI